MTYKLLPCSFLFAAMGCVASASLPYGVTSFGPPALAAPEAAPSGGGASGWACAQDRAGLALTSAGPLAKGTTHGCVDRGSDDVYALAAPADAAAGTLYVFELSAAEHLCATIYDQDRRQQGGGECVGDSESTSFWAAVAPGTTLYVKLERTHTSTPTPYQLRVRARALVDPDEPNDTWKTAYALELGTSHEALLHRLVNKRRAGTDRYRVELDAAGTLSIVVDPRSEDALAFVKVYDRDRREVTRERADNAGAVVRLSEPLGAGTYYVEVSEDSTLDAYGISNNGARKPTSNYTRPYSIVADFEAKARRRRVSRR